MSASLNNLGSGASLPPPPPLSAPPSHRNSASHQPSPQSTHQNHISTGQSHRGGPNDNYGDSSRDASSNGTFGRPRSPQRSSGANPREDWWSRTDVNKARRDPWERDGGWPHRREFSDSSNDSQRSRPHRQSSFQNHNNAPADSPSSSRNTHTDHPRPSWSSDDTSRSYPPPHGSSSTSNPNLTHAHHRQPPTTHSNTSNPSSTSPKTRIFPPPPPPPPQSYCPPGPRGADPPYPLDDEIGRAPPSSQKWR
jgi:hypothetical protein